MTVTVTIQTEAQGATVTTREKGSTDGPSRTDTIAPNSAGTFHAHDALSLTIEEDAPAADGDDASEG